MELPKECPIGNLATYRLESFSPQPPSFVAFAAAFAPNLDESSMTVPLTDSTETRTEGGIYWKGEAKRILSHFVEGLELTAGLID